MGPKPDIQVQRVDLSKTDLPGNPKLYAIVLDNVLTPAECKQLILAAEARTGGVWEQALVNLGLDRQELLLDYRNSGRIIWDDRSIVEKIWDRIKDSVPEIEVLKDMPHVTGPGPVKRKETWQLTRLNERMRFLKYGAGQYFRRKFFSKQEYQDADRTTVAHCDGAYETPDMTERSYYTLHLYLNESDPDGPQGELIGGATTFHAGRMLKEYKVNPKFGRVLIFQHKALVHSGEEVQSGTKITLRTDIMYSKLR